MAKAGQTTASSSFSNAHLRQVAKQVKTKISQNNQKLQKHKTRAKQRIHIKESAIKILHELERESSLPPHLRERILQDRTRLQGELENWQETSAKIHELAHETKRLYHEIVSLFHKEIIATLQAGKAREGGVMHGPFPDNCGYRCIARKPGEKPKRPKDQVDLPMSLWDT